MALPFLAMGIGAVAKKFARKAAGKALGALTGGKLLGKGGGKTALGRIAGGAIATATTVPVLRSAGRAVSKKKGELIGDTYSESETSFGRRAYRRMNPMNVRALRRSVRRIHSAEKLFRQVFTITKGSVTVRKARRS